MFRSDLYLSLLAHQRRLELLDDAQRERLARQALEGQARHNHFYCRALIWLGRRLVAWGLRMQVQHSALSSTSAFPATHHI